MKYKSGELEKVQSAALNILKCVINICDESQISYFIIGGTALGAVRHKGFIPWDDDIDIGMTRENYDRFLEIAPTKLHDKYFLQHYSTDSATPFYFAKVRMNGTLFVEDYCKKLPIHHGIFLDIFPYDTIPDEIRLRKKHRRHVSFWSELFISKSVASVFTESNRISRNFKLLVRKLLHLALFFVSKDFLFTKLDNANKKYNDASGEFVNFVKYPFLMIKKSSVQSLDQIEFEGVKMTCCKNVSEYLEHHFNKNYMTLPTPDKRVNHRPIKLHFIDEKG